MEPQNFVHLIGDSTLDNIWWHLNNIGTQEKPNFDINDAKKKSVEGKLNNYLGCDYTIINHSFDGFTTTSLLNGDIIGRVLFRSYKNPKFISYLNDKTTQIKENNLNYKKQNNYVLPLHNLAIFVHQKKKPDKHYVILSVGGNDFRENLTNPLRLLVNIFTVQKRYLKIISRIQNMKEVNIKPILMFQYRTDATRSRDPYQIYTILKVIGVLAATLQSLSIAAIVTTGLKFFQRKMKRNTGIAIITVALSTLYISTRFVGIKNIKNILSGRHIGVSTFGCLLEKLYQPILKKAKKDQIPVLDLSNSFNPFNHNLYTASIEPNIAGGDLIANGISEIVKSYDSYKGKIVSMEEINDFKVEEINSKKWEVVYPKKL